MEILESLRSKAAANRRHIVLPEGQDERTLQAARIITDRGYAKVTIVGDPEDVRKRALEVGVTLDDVEILDHIKSKDFDKYAEAYYELRRAKAEAKGKPAELTPDEARKVVEDPLYYANMLVRDGKADGTVAGATNTTAHTVRAALKCLGVRPGLKTVSSFFLMIAPNQSFGEKGAMLFADCGVVIDPDPVQLAEISITTAESCRLFLDVEPRIALLSFSTKGSAKHEKIDKVTEALSVVKARRPELVIDGELQVDAALIPRIGRSKAPNSPVAGKANVLIFPDIQSGNIGYKLAERMSGGMAIGPVLQGFDYASNDLSRGCKAEDIVDTVVITALQSIACERARLERSK
ncbi:MAG: phosphate acetyltransferase [bacterium]|nr:phosphate acetyltransferase [bacterium]